MNFPKKTNILFDILRFSIWKYSSFLNQQQAPADKQETGDWTSTYHDGESNGSVDHQVGYGVLISFPASDGADRKVGKVGIRGIHTAMLQPDMFSRCKPVVHPCPPE